MNSDPHTDPARMPARRFLRGNIARYFGVYFLAFFCLFLVFYDARVGVIIKQMGAVRWRWMLAAALMEIFVYVLEGLQWQLLLKPRGRIPWYKATQAIYVGLFANEILPLRAGEVARTYLVSRWLNTSFVAILPSIMLQRFLDGIWLIIAIGITAILVDLPKNLIQAADIFGVVLLSATFFLILLIFRKEKKLEKGSVVTQYRWKPLQYLASVIQRIAVGIQEIGTSGSFFAAFLVAFFVLFFQVLSFWLMMLAYGITVSIWVGAAVLFIVLLGTAIPNAPANLGTFQFFTVLGLSLFDVDKTTATGFSVISFSLITALFLILGFFAVGMSGIHFKQIKDEIKTLWSAQRKNNYKILNHK